MFLTVSSSLMSFDCLRLKQKGYTLSGLYSLKSDIFNYGFKTIYCDFTHH